MIDNPLLGLSQRLPPSNTQAEQVLLGALLANNLAMRHVEAFLEPKHFVDPIHGDIFHCIMQRWRAGCLVDAVTLRAIYQDTGVLDEVGGTAYLGQLLTANLGIIDAWEYGHSIHDAWLRRQLIDVGEELVNRAFGADPEMDGQQQAKAASWRLIDLLVPVPSVKPEGYGVDPTKDAAWFRNLLQHDAMEMAGLDGRGDPMLLETGIDREEALALARFHEAEERGCRILNRFGEADYHCTRSERFWNALNRLELEGGVDQHEVDQAASQARNPADIRGGGEVVGGNVVDMQEPAPHVSVALYGDDSALIDVGGEPANEAEDGPGLIPMLGDDGVLIGYRKGPERSA